MLEPCLVVRGGLANPRSSLRCWTEGARHGSTARGFGNCRNSGQNDARPVCHGMADE